MFEPAVAKSSPDTKSITLDFTSNVILSGELLISKLSNMDYMSDREIYKIVSDYYEFILNEIFTTTDATMKRYYIDLFTQPKFIIALTQVMYTITPDHTIRRRMNKMSYDYLVMKDSKNKDSYVSGLLMALSKTVNRDKIPKLCSLPLPEDLASLLSLARYSSEKEVTNVKRLNRVLMNQPLESITEQKIVDIYLALFDHILPLFTGVMLDVVSPQTLTPDGLEIYGLITLAALDLMNELPITDIKKGLVLFDEDRKVQYADYPLRINLESCSSEDYSRILQAIDLLKTEGVYISTY